MEEFEGSPPRSWQQLDAELPVELRINNDGLSGPFFGCRIDSQLDSIDILHFVKNGEPPVTAVWELLSHLGFVHPASDEAHIDGLQSSIAQAYDIYQAQCVTYKGTMKEAVADHNRTLRRLTQSYEAFGLLRAAKAICDHYPDTRGKAIEGVVRILIASEQQSAREAETT